MKPIKICFFLTYAYALFNPDSKHTHGGAEIQLSLIAKELAKSKDFEIIFIVGDFGQKKIEIIDNIKLIRTFNPQPNDSKIKKLWQAFRYFYLLIKLSPNIVVSSTANALTGIITFYCKVFKKKSIFRVAHINNVNTRYINEMGILGKIYRFGLENSDSIITQTEQQKNALFKYHKRESNIIKNLVFSDVCNKVVKKNHIFWVSRNQSWKNPELFINLSVKFPDEKFIMICPQNSPQSEKEWKILKEKAESTSNMVFIERVPLNEIQKYFDKAKVFVNTSDFEGFPNTFIQAGLGKTPILSYIVNPDNFINEWDCGFVCDGSMQSMIENLNILLNDNNTWELKSRNVYEYVKSEHNAEVGIKKFKSIISVLYNQ